MKLTAKGSVWADPDGIRVSVTLATDKGVSYRALDQRARMGTYSISAKGWAEHFSFVADTVALAAEIADSLFYEPLAVSWFLIRVERESQTAWISVNTRDRIAKCLATVDARLSAEVAGWAPDASGAVQVDVSPEWGAFRAIVTRPA